MPEYRLSCYALIGNQRGEILLLQRASGDRLFAGQWEVPGGKLDAGETIEAGLLREVREEAGLEIEAGPLAGAVGLPREAMHVVMLFFHARAKELSVRLSREHQAYVWAAAGEVTGLEITPPLRRFLEEHPGALKQLLS